MLVAKIVSAPWRDVAYMAPVMAAVAAAYAFLGRFRNTIATARLRHGLATASRLALSVFGGTLVYAAFVERQAAIPMRLVQGVVGVVFALPGILCVIGLQAPASRIYPPVDRDDRRWTLFAFGMLFLFLGLFDQPRHWGPVKDFPWAIPALAVGILFQGALTCIRGNDCRNDSGCGE